MRVHGYVEKGVEEGAEVVTGGKPVDGSAALYPPTVLAKVDNSMTVAQEEIFGPVVTVTLFEDEKDARLANDFAVSGADGDRLDRDPAKGHWLARRIKAGTVGINMPFTASWYPVRRLQAVRLRVELGLDTPELYPRDEERSSRPRLNRSTPSP